MSFAKNWASSRSMAHLRCERATLCANRKTQPGTRFYSSSIASRCVLDQRVDDAFHLHEPRAFHQHRNVAAQCAAQIVYERIDARVVLRAAAERTRGERRVLAER